MICPGCGWRKPDRSSRRGLAEGLFLRILQVAPFRCPECGKRFMYFNAGRASRRLKRHSTVSGYLGIPQNRRRQFRQRLITVIAGSLLLATAFYLVLQWSSTSTGTSTLP